MADQNHGEGASTSEVGAGSSESTVELHIKTLDSQIYTFHVDKNMPVSLFKEKIASEIGLPVGQQRLIFRGKVLKDDHLLSEYHVESGHSLHLVARQPSQPQSSSGVSSGESNANSTRGQDATSGSLLNRFGEFSHILGTLNVGDQGEGIVPDFTRTIGAVLNSFGIGGQNTTNSIGITQPNVQVNAPVQAPQGNETEGTRSNVRMQNQAGSHTSPGQAFPSQSLLQVLQIPLGAALPVPSLNAPIPDSLSTLSEFLSRMEQALAQNGYQSNQPPMNGNIPRVELPTNARGLSTPEALSIILRHAQRLLSGHAIAALSHVAGHLEQEGGSTDPIVRSQIQTESMHVGVAVQHLGALLLELGRVMLTLRMGQSPAESYVNAGPAVYVSPSGPNPIMVQPFPHQASSLFGGFVPTTSNPGPSGPVGIVNVQRHVNVHIHTAVGTRATNGEGMQGEHINGSGYGNSGQTRVLPVRNVFATAVPSRPPVSVSSASQSGVSVSQPPPDSVSISTVVAEINSQIRNLVDNMQSENQTSTGQSESSTIQNPSIGSGASNDGSNQETNVLGNRVGESPSLPDCVSEREDRKTHLECHQSSSFEDAGGVVSLEEIPYRSSIGNPPDCSSGQTTLKTLDDSECAPTSSHGNDNPQVAPAIPLGLGLAGLQPKRRSWQLKSQAKNVDDGTSSAHASNQTHQTITNGQQVLQSLANKTNTHTPSSGQLPSALEQITESVPMGMQGDDVASAMSQVLQSPALNGLLAGVSEQTGIGSPNVLRNMLEQLTQSPAIRSTVNQIAQQVETQDLGDILSGFGTGQGGSFDLSRMVQQMIPIVSQALSSRPNVPQPIPTVGPEPPCNRRGSSRDENISGQNSQVDLQQVALRIRHQSPPEEIFRSVVESAVFVCGNGTGMEDLVDELCREEGLASEFMQMLRRDVSRRLEGES